MMAAQGRASWTEYGWWCLTAAVEDKGGGCSMAAGAFNGGNDGQLQGGGKAVGAKRKMQTQQSNEGGGSLWMLSNAFRLAKRWWWSICGMSVMAPQQQLWGCSIVGAVVGVHPWGAGGSALSLEGCWRRLPRRGPLAATLVASGQWNYGGGIVGAAVLAILGRLYCLPMYGTHIHEACCSSLTYPITRNSLTSLLEPRVSTRSYDTQLTPSTVT